MAAALDDAGERLLEPVLVRYIGDQPRPRCGGIRTRQRFLMQSNGGVMRFAAAIAGA